MMKKLAVFVFIAVMSVASSGCAMNKSFGPYMGKVIDKETKEPLEGAAVLAVFRTERPGPAGSISYFLDAKETLTDKDGEYMIEKFTVKSIKFGHAFSGDPMVWIFKPGYGCYPDHKDVKMIKGDGSMPSNEHFTIELPRLTDKEERRRNLGCYSTTVPDNKMMIMINKYSEERVNLGLKPSRRNKSK